MKSILLKITVISCVTFFLLSCKKDNIENHGSNKVTLSFGKEIADQEPSNKANLSKNISADSSEQTILTTTNSGLDVKATLIPISSHVQDFSISKKANNTSQTSTKTNELQDNIKLKILVYNSDGSLFLEKEHTYKRNAPEIIISDMLVGSEYTFIIYSTNSTESIPEASNKNNLSQLRIDDLTEQLIYFKEVKMITSGGNNMLNIKLKHQFSEVSTELKIDQTGDLAGSRVSQMAAPTISPAYDKASFNLATGTPIFDASNLMQNGKTIGLVTDNLTGNLITSSSTLVMANGDNSTLLINSITINDFLNTIRLEGFKIIPGRKYKLKLEVACPCIEDVTTPNAFERANLPESTVNSFTFKDANYGAILNFYRIDNSFNLKINNQHIFVGTADVITRNINDFTYKKNEIQFQGYGKFQTRYRPPNIRFADGSKWGQGTIKDIWEMECKKDQNPILQIVINKNGNVTMYGSKNSTGGEPFFLLQPLKNTDQVSILDGANTYRYNVNGDFQKITWKNENKIEFSQIVDDATLFRGSITGKRIIKCSP